MLQVKLVYSESFTAQTMDGATAELIKVVDALGNSYGLLDCGGKLKAWCGSIDKNSVECVLVEVPRVSLVKPEAPECVAHLADVPQESNADVMARAVAFVRDIRLTAEYLAAHDGEPATLDAGVSDNEQVRALAHEQARADAARVLSGVALCDIAPCPSNRDPMAGECCDTCGAALESGQIGDCDECQEEPQEFINHYKCYRCAHEWADQWTAQCDDDCPECGARHVSPHTSEDA